MLLVLKKPPQYPHHLLISSKSNKSEILTRDVNQKRVFCSDSNIFQTEYDRLAGISVKVTKSVTMNIFRKKKYFLFKSFLKEELSYNFTINLFSTAENCMEK